MAKARALCFAMTDILYSNLEYLYTTYNYPTSHIWNCDESSVQAERSDRATLLAKRSRRYVHLIESYHRKII